MANWIKISAITLSAVVFSLLLVLSFHFRSRDYPKIKLCLQNDEGPITYINANEINQKFDHETTYEVVNVTTPCKDDSPGLNQMSEFYLNKVNMLFNVEKFIHKIIFQKGDLSLSYEKNGQCRFQEFCLVKHENIYEANICSGNYR